MIDGTLEDPHGEFFVASDPRVTDEAKLWTEKYSIEKSMYFTIKKSIYISLGNPHIPPLMHWDIHIKLKICIWPASSIAMNWIV